MLVVVSKSIAPLEESWEINKRWKWVHYYTQQPSKSSNLCNNPCIFLKNEIKEINLLQYELKLSKYSLHFLK